MTALFAALAAVLTLAVPSAAAESTATLKGVDLYRSDALTLRQVENTLGPDLRNYARLKGSGRAGSERPAEEARAFIERRLRELSPLAFASLTYSEYVTSAQKSSYITLDVVDRSAASARMPFRKAPQGSLSDPHGLLADWAEYQRLGAKLRDQGQIDSAERPACPGFYCTWGSATPELAALERRFVDGARGDKKALVAVLEQDADPRRRAAALYLLSYGEDGAEVSGLASRALLDPAPDVRGAALEILSDVALYHKDVLIDAARVVAALDYPLSSDRAKAMSVLVGLADRPAYRPYVLTRGTPYLVKLLRLEQPSNHDLAFTLLSMLSQQPYDQHDYDSWERWAEGVAASTAAVVAPPQPPIPGHGPR